MTPSTALSAWLFPRAGHVHQDWFSKWYSPGLINGSLLQEATPLNNMLECRIRRYCDTPVIPTRDYVIEVCKLSNQQRLRLGQQLAMHLFAPAMRKIIHGDSVATLKSTVGAQNYTYIINCTTRACLPDDVFSCVERSLQSACLSNTLPAWWQGLAIRLLETLIGARQQFNQRRLSLHVSPATWQQRPASILLNRRTLQNLCVEHNLIESSCIGDRNDA